MWSRPRPVPRIAWPTRRSTRPLPFRPPTIASATRRHLLALPWRPPLEPRETVHIAAAAREGRRILVDPPPGQPRLEPAARWLDADEWLGLRLGAGLARRSLGRGEGFVLRRLERMDHAGDRQQCEQSRDDVRH